MSSITCSVRGCHNNWIKRRQQFKQQCLEHKVERHECCGATYDLHPPPKNDERLRLWLKALNLKRPPKRPYVCSFHFVDGKPTDEHPYPEKWLGYDVPSKKSHRLLARVPVSESLHFARTDSTMQNQTATQESSIKSFQCSQCVLIFKSKTYLFDHLSNVHGCNVESALTLSGLKCTSPYSCLHCAFQHSDWSTFAKHKNECSASNQLKEDVKAKAVSHSKAKSTVNSTTSLKKYKKPSQTITKYFSTLSGSNVKLLEKDNPVSVDDSKGTLILEESSSNSNPHGSGVFTVTAKSIDISTRGTFDRFLLDDRLFNADVTNPKPAEQTPNAGKRTIKDRFTKPPAKRAKLEKVAINLPETTTKQLGFEVSEDEMEAKGDLVNGDAEGPAVYPCKHCDFADVDVKRMCTHYLNNHPYIRYNWEYIKEPSDHSATFRCLECPVEFSCVTDLSKHYKKKHPEAQSDMTMKTCELKMVFKCFVCLFTTGSQKALKQHHKEMHPTYEVDNPLMYCRYASNRQSLQLSSSEKCSPERSSGNPTFREADNLMYQCNSCTFSHRSVVVLHVHYKKNHPDEEITLDKIKQSVCVTSPTSGHLRPVDSVALKDKCTPPKDIMDIFKESKNKPKDPQQKISSSLVNPKQPQVVLKAYSESPESNKVERVEGKANIGKSVPEKCTAKRMADIFKSSGKVQSNKHQGETEACSENDLNCGGSIGQEKSMTKSNPYACAADLFYCQVCNYGNLTVQGVLNHQIKTHSKIHAIRESILKHTALIRDEIKKTKGQPKDPSFPFQSSGLPLPLIKDGETDVLFCHLCNYRQYDATRVMQHYFKIHRDFKITSKQIRLHSAAILKKVQNTCHGKKGNQKKTSKKSSDSKTPRILQCPNCIYAAEHLYLLRRHLRKIHRETYSAADVLKMYCQQGTLQPGYHCDMCVFSSKEAVELQEHFKDRHLNLNRSMEYISQLYFDPKMCSKQKEPKIKQRDGQSDSDDPGSSSAQQDCKIYSCRACSFRGTSVSSITCHYRAIHPWSVKEDGSVPDIIDSEEQTSIIQLEDGDEIATFENYQVPLEFDNSPASSHEETEVFNCSQCSASFHTQRGLDVHRGMKHAPTNPDKVKEQRAPNNTRVHIFKCLHCAYVNTSYHGVLTHIQMKHPALEVKADSLYVDSVHLNNIKLSAPGEKLRFSGYRCKKCPQVFASRDMFNKHNENHHKKLPFKLKVKLTPRLSVVKHKSPSYSTQESVVKDASDVQDNEFKCVLCTASFIAATRLAIHYSKKHGRETFLKYFVPIYGQKSKKPAPSSPNCSQTKELDDTSEVSSTAGGCIKKLMYKCSHCSYLNSSYHGTLTHMQMKHPGTGPKAEKLRKVEILTSDLVGCTLGKGDNERGYMCKKCPQIHPTVKRLRTHTEREHKHSVPATSEHSAETEPLPVSKDPSSVLGSELLKKKKLALAKFMYNCSLCSYSTLIRNQLRSHYIQRHGKSAHLKFFVPVYYHLHRNKNLVHGVKDNLPETTALAIQDAKYKCHMCSYKAIYRRYLHSHYRKKHKLELRVICKLLQKYNRYSDKNLDAESQNGVQVECKHCPNASFELPELLIAHYSIFHRSQYVLDFTVLAGRTDKSTGIFRCNHCQKKIFGIKNLHLHLDRHRARKNKRANLAKIAAATVTTAAPRAASVEVVMGEELPAPETLEEFVQGTSAVESSVSASPPSATDPEPPQVEISDSKNICKLCKRSFMSLKGLRSHERSHAALAAIKKVDNLSTSAAKHKTENYLIYKSGVQKPFMCSICSYRTSVMGLWKSHMIKKHLDIIDGSSNTGIQDEDTNSSNKDSLHTSEEMDVPESDEETENALYSEPPDVQRQLNHYHLMAHVGSSSKTSLQDAQFPVTGLLNCELCSFNSEHQSSMRRHYMHRHGKKIIRCKDCNFFTGLRKNLERHMEMGHCAFQSGPAYHKDFRCPFCLYQSKDKNNMIDHIILHREEHVTPMQVRRPKLSRYLHGIVFRCHKCTFTSASAENLRLHMMKHDDMKPFRCRLCYFDCCRLSDLEAHLCDKHQVVRNHRLVGQVNLDKLSTKVSRTPDEDEEDENEELLCKLETETKFVTACKELEKDTEENDTVQMEHSYYKKECHSEGCALKAECEDDAKETTTVEEMSEKAEVRGITLTENREGIQGTVPNGSSAEFKDLSDPMKDEQMDESQYEPKLRGSEDEAEQQSDEAAEESSLTHVELDEEDKNMPINTHEDRRHYVTTHMENDLQHEGFSPDKDGNGCMADKKPVQDQETTQEAVVEEDGLNVDKASVTLDLKSGTAPPDSSMELLNDDTRPIEGSSGASVMIWDQEQTQNPAKADRPMDVYGEMPVLENEYLKEEMPYLRPFSEISHSHRVEETGEDDTLRYEAENQCTDQQNRGEDGTKEVELQCESEGEFAADTNGEVEALNSLLTEEKLFTCELCGRTLDNGSELERHILRHGM